MRLQRQNNTLITNWWWTIDRVTLIAIALMIAIGSILVTSASPAVAERIGLDTFYLRFF